jgi:hypothetical protein
MITDTINHPYASFSPVAQGYGEVAEHIRAKLKDIESVWDESVYFSGNTQISLAALGNLAARADSENWDGENGSAICVESLDLASKLLRHLPRHLSPPEIDLDSDGEVNLRWYWGRGKRLTITVGSNQVLSYAWMTPNVDGELERNYGVAASKGTFPTAVSDFFYKIGK